MLRFVVPLGTLVTAGLAVDIDAADFMAATHCVAVEVGCDVKYNRHADAVNGLEKLVPDIVLSVFPR